MNEKEMRMRVELWLNTLEESVKRTPVSPEFAGVRMLPEIFRSILDLIDASKEKPKDQA